jgi:hypothetical protein
MSCLICQVPARQSKLQTRTGTICVSRATAVEAGANGEALASTATIARRIVGRLIMSGSHPRDGPGW